MAEREFDILNAGYKKRAMPYDKYFGEMNITKRQKEERIDAAERFEEDMLFFILLIALLIDNGLTNYFSAVDQFVARFTDNVRRFITDDEFLSWYPTLLANEILDSTLRNIDDPWFLSDDRAMFNAENEANTVLNRSDFLKAVLSGKTKKTWISQMDNKVRKTHRKVESKTIPISDLFEVGNALMRFPHDYEMADNYPEELIGCRCSVNYS